MLLHVNQHFIDYNALSYKQSKITTHKATAWYTSSCTNTVTKLEGEA